MMYNTDFCTVFLIAHHQIQIFCIYCTTFYTSFFFTHQCSNLSPFSPQCKWNLHKFCIIYLYLVIAYVCLFFFTFGVMIPHLVTAAAHRPVSWLTVFGVKSSVKQFQYQNVKFQFQSSFCAFFLRKKSLDSHDLHNRKFVCNHPSTLCLWFSSDSQITWPFVHLFCFCPWMMYFKVWSVFKIVPQDEIVPIFQTNFSSLGVSLNA